MPVPSARSDLSTVTANNSPPGTESAKGNIDNYLRAHAQFIAQNYADVQTAQATADAALPKAGGALTGPITSDIALAAGKKVIFEGATDDAFETTLYVVDPTADRSLNLPNKDGTLATDDSATTSAKGLVQLATDTEARALSDTSKPITPGTLKTAMTGSNQSLGASGYQKLPGGLILQWGVIAGASGSGTLVFPTAFPMACINVQLSNNTSGNTPVWQTISAANFTYVAPTTMNIYWFALGY